MFVCQKWFVLPLANGKLEVLICWNWGYFHPFSGIPSDNQMWQLTPPFIDDFPLKPAVIRNLALPRFIPRGYVVFFTMGFNGSRRGGKQHNRKKQKQGVGIYTRNPENLRMGMILCVN